MLSTIVFNTQKPEKTLFFAEFLTFSTIKLWKTIIQQRFSTSILWKMWKTCFEQEKYRLISRVFMVLPVVFDNENIGKIDFF